MASLFDVETALAALVSGAVYPTGTGNPSVVAPVGVIIYPGWPDKADLDTDLAPTGGAGSSTPCTRNHISIYNDPGGRNVTRYIDADAEQMALVAATYTLTTGTLIVTVGGAPPGTYFPQNFCIFANGKPYVYQAVAGDTAAQVAAALAALINVGVPGTSATGAVIHFPATARIGAVRIGTIGTATTEAGRVEKVFRIIAWTDTPQRRAALTESYVPLLMATPWMTMPDGFKARLRLQSDFDNDFVQKQGIFRHDTLVTVEWARTISEVDTVIVAIQESIGDANGNLIV